MIIADFQIINGEEEDKEGCPDKAESYLTLQKEGNGNPSQKEEQPIAKTE